MASKLIHSPPTSCPECESNLNLTVVTWKEFSNWAYVTCVACEIVIASISKINPGEITLYGTPYSVSHFTHQSGEAAWESVGSKPHFTIPTHNLGIPYQTWLNDWEWLIKNSSIGFGVRNPWDKSKKADSNLKYAFEKFILEESHHVEDCGPQFEDCSSQSSPKQMPVSKPKVKSYDHLLPEDIKPESVGKVCCKKPLEYILWAGEPEFSTHTPHHKVFLFCNKCEKLYHQKYPIDHDHGTIWGSKATLKNCHHSGVFTNKPLHPQTDSKEKNFYLVIEIDGQKTVHKLGPKGATEGFTLRINQRCLGQSIETLRVVGKASDTGKVTLTAKKKGHKTAVVAKTVR